MTTKNDRTGRLKNAPVVYVLAQIRISPIAKLGEKYIANIQDRFRGNYPRFQAFQTQEISVPVPASGQVVQVVSSPRWEFADIANRSGFVILEDAVTYHTTDYTTFEDFLGKLRSGLEVIQSELNIALTTRIGLRYIDLIVPDNGEDLGKYVTERLLGFPVSDISKNQGQQQTIAATRTDEGHLVLRFRQDSTDAILPRDLADLSLAPCREHPAGTPKAILDTDHYAIADEPFEVDKVIDYLDKLHDAISSSFKTIVTDHAWNKWK